MELSNIEIHKRQSYEGGSGTYLGKIKIIGQYGEVVINLDQQLCADVLKLCAASLVRATKDIADNMSASVFEAATDNLLEAPDA